MHRKQWIHYTHDLRNNMGRECTSAVKATAKSMAAWAATYIEHEAVQEVFDAGNNGCKQQTKHQI